MVRPSKRQFHSRDSQPGSRSNVPHDDLYRETSRLRGRKPTRQTTPQQKRSRTSSLPPSKLRLRVRQHSTNQLPPTEEHPTARRKRVASEKRQPSDHASVPQHRSPSAQARQSCN